RAKWERQRQRKRSRRRRWSRPPDGRPRAPPGGRVRVTAARRRPARGRAAGATGRRGSVDAPADRARGAGVDLRRGSGRPGARRPRRRAGAAGRGPFSRRGRGLGGDVAGRGGAGAERPARALRRRPGDAARQRDGDVPTARPGTARRHAGGGARAGAGRLRPADGAPQRRGLRRGPARRGRAAARRGRRAAVGGAPEYLTLPVRYRCYGRSMKTPPIILVSGWWLGAWAWDEVAALLRSKGHEVSALTLPGLDSVDTDRSAITQSDHVEAIVAAVRAAPAPVLLAVHSGAGFTGYAASDRVPERIARMVYVDTGAGVGAPDAEFTAAEKLLPSPEDLAANENLEGLSEEQLSTFRERAVPEPGGVLRERVELTNEERRDIPS